MRINIFVISLLRSTERREHIAQILNSLNLQWEFFDGIDGSKLSKNLLQLYQDESLLYTDGRIKLNSGEIGCALSHLKVYEKIVFNDLEHAIIIEDDVILKPDFIKFVNIVTTDLTLFKKFELVLLGFHRNGIDFSLKSEISYWKREKIRDLKIGKPTLWYWGTYGYYITRQGAIKLFKAGYPLRMQSDCLTANSPYYDVKLGIMSEPIIIPNLLNQGSTIRDKPLEVLENIVRTPFNINHKMKFIRLIKIKLYEMNAVNFYMFLKKCLKIEKIRLVKTWFNALIRKTSRKYLFIEHI